MNDKDKKEFEKWWDEIRLRGQSTFGIVAITWQAACEYKQKVIDELESENTKLIQEIEKFKGYLEAWDLKN